MKPPGMRNRPKSHLTLKLHLQANQARVKPIQKTNFARLQVSNQMSVRQYVISNYAKNDFEALGTLVEFFGTDFFLKNVLFSSVGPFSFFVRCYRLFLKHQFNITETRNTETD